MRPAPLARPLLVLAVLSMGALTGCRSGTALHSRYNNFRAYYNTYYNASRTLEDGERALEQAAVTIDQGRLVRGVPRTEAAGGTSGPFQEAIDKSAELLRNRPDSKWADDALLVIGKAYFYQRNLVGAEQKFRETMAAAGPADDRRLADEARFWLGRTYAAGDRFDEGVLVLEEAARPTTAETAGGRARMQLALGELYARAGRWDEAAETLRAGAADVERPRPGRPRLRAARARSRSTPSAGTLAAAGLRRRHRPRAGLRARLRGSGQPGAGAGRRRRPDRDGARRASAPMRRDDKNYQRRAEVALVEARLRAAAGESGDALGLFRDVLYDESARRRARPGQAHYRLAEFYRDALDDYVRAVGPLRHRRDGAARARPPTSAPRAGPSSTLTDEAATYACGRGARSAASPRRTRCWRSARSTTTRSRARIAAIEGRAPPRVPRGAAPAEEARRPSRLQRRGRRRLYRRPGPGPQPTSRRSRPSPARRAASCPTATRRRSRPGRIAFEQRWGDRPLVPNWRRRAAVEAGAVASGPRHRRRDGPGRPRLDAGAAAAGPDARSRARPTKREELTTSSWPGSATSSRTPSSCRSAGPTRPPRSTAPSWSETPGAPGRRPGALRARRDRARRRP